MKRAAKVTGIQVQMLASLLVAWVSSAPSIGLASPIDVQTLTQLMIEDQGQEVSNIGLTFGADPSSSIKFASTTNPIAMSYSFTTMAGSIYEGLSLTITGTGLFDPTTNIMSVNSSTMLGSISYTSSGTNVIDLSAGADDYNKFIDPTQTTKDGKKYNDEHQDSTIFPNGNSLVRGYKTLNGSMVPGTENSGLDFSNSSSGAWNFSLEFPDAGIGVVSVGFSPPVGGAGTFTTTVVASEPSSIALLGCGLFGILITCRRRRRTQPR